MKIKELFELYKDTPPDRTLARDLQVSARVIYLPQKPLLGGYIQLEDETGILEAVASNSKIYETLKSYVDAKPILKLKGRLDKTEFGNIAFSIQEVQE